MRLTLVLGVVLFAACGGSARPGRYLAWSGPMDASTGAYEAGVYVRQDGTTISGSYTAGRVGLTGGITGSAIDGGYSVHIRPTACDGGFDGIGLLDGSELRFSYSGSSCAGEDHGTGVLLQEYDLPAH